MDTLLSLASFGVILAVFGVIAAILGEDTRDGFADGFREDPFISPPLPVTTMTDWATFADAAPELAATGRRAPRAHRARGGDCWPPSAATLPPRINPVSVGIVDGHLLTFVHRRLGEGPRPARGRPVRPARPPGPRRAARVPGPRPGARGRPAALRQPGDRRLAVRGRTTATACSSSRSSRRCSASGADADDWPPVYRTLARRSLTPLAEHDDLARRLARAEAVERVLEVRERQAPVDEPVDRQPAREVRLRVAREVDARRPPTRSWSPRIRRPPSTNGNASNAAGLRRTASARRGPPSRRAAAPRSPARSSPAARSPRTRSPARRRRPPRGCPRRRRPGSPGRPGPSGSRPACRRGRSWPG